MERSQLPLSSLLGLFGALLMLSPELLLGTPEDLSDLPVTDPGVQKALSFAVEKYNQDRGDSTNYFKVLRVLMAQSQLENRVEYSLLTQLVTTKCTKTASPKLTYKNLQKCQRLPGNVEKPICFYKVKHVLSNMELIATSCL